MKRLRQIKKYGNSFVISLFQTDMKDMELKEGDEIDIQSIKTKRGKKCKEN
jgi:antitoxin component of MazEF toxin-antitoxin module